ncbi:MAG: Lrp/AsnC family transcriptional regulator [Candidatus Bathyarchaeota archaeon]|nr:Lrp/AsnC family transcriptional regulator [Candidatus Bathyarchaeota archaeon]
MQIKDLDKKILKQLLKDSSKSLSELATKVGATRQTIAKKIDHFIDSGLVRSFTVKLDQEKLGLSIKAYVLIKEEPKSEYREKNEMMIKDLPEVASFYYLFGRYDAVAEVLVKDKEELTNLVKRIHQLQGMRETETLIVHSVVKDDMDDPYIKILEK